MSKYQVMVESKEGGKQKYDNVIEYDHKDGDLRMTFQNGQTKTIGSDDIKTTDVKPMPEGGGTKLQEMNESDR